MKGEETVGWYNAACRLVSVLSLIPAAYFISIFPSMSRFHTTSKESLRLIYEKSFKYMLILVVPIGVGTTILADKITLLVFGPEYFNSIVALQVLVWSVGLTFVNLVFVQLFSSVNKQGVVARVLMVCAVSNVLPNIVLIPE
jgi:O-antigen/teichoic acid export membrane protein